MLKVYMKKGGAPRVNLAYGWRATTTLAKQQNERLANGQFRRTEERPVMNSDTYALFASGESCYSRFASCRMRVLICIRREVAQRPAAGHIHPRQRQSDNDTPAEAGLADRASVQKDSNGIRALCDKYSGRTGRCYCCGDCVRDLGLAAMCLLCGSNLD